MSVAFPKMNYYADRALTERRMMEAATDPARDFIARRAGRAI